MTRDSQSWWTIDGGYCLPYPLAYETLHLDTTVYESKCLLSWKCAMTNSLNQNCICKNAAECHKEVADSCLNPYLYYPSSGMPFAPYVYLEYVRGRDWTNKSPGRFALRGRVKCIGYQSVVKTGLGYQIVGSTSYDYIAYQTIMCMVKEGPGIIRNSSGSHYDIMCWNNTQTFNNRPYQVSLFCKAKCISKYRIRDGIQECLYSEEHHTVNNSCPQIQSHRLQCSSFELTCLLPGALANWFRACSNSLDEIDYESNTVFVNNIKCQQRADPGCAYFRNYIRISSYDDIKRTTIANNSVIDKDSTTIIPFRSYCNSFFDTAAAIDEETEFCEKWICSRDQYQCLSGQCILQSWVCDGRIIPFDHFFC